jgi:polygalacturonase
MSLTKAHNRMVQGSYLNVLDYGAVADGVTGATTAIQAAIDAASSAGGSTVYFPSGNYLLNASLLLKSNVTLLGEDGAKISRSSDSFKIIGSTSASLTSLTAGATLKKGSNIVTLNAGSYSSVSVDDYLYVKDKNSANVDFIQDFVAASGAVLVSPDEWVYMVQTFKIIEKLGSNKVRVDSAAIIDFPITGAGSIYKVDQAIKNVSITNLTFENNSSVEGTNAENAFINTYHVYGLDIENCKFNLNGLSGGVYKNFGALRVINCDFNAPKYLGVFLRQACPNSVISGNTFRNHTANDASIFIEAHNYNITVSNNTFDGARNYELTNAAALISAIQCDAKVTNCVFDGNTINGYGVGIRMELGCMMNVISNNVFSNMDICGLRLNESSFLSISNNKFFNCGLSTTAGTLAVTQSAIFASQCVRLNIDGNVMAWETGYSKPAIFGTFDYTYFKNNTIANTTKIIANGSFNEISNNKIESKATDQIISISGTSKHHNIIEHNQIYATAVGGCQYAIRIDDGSECNKIRWNASSDCSNTVALTATTNAQWLFENTRFSESNTATVNVYNVEISAPVMPANATMPRRFRIYSTTTSGGTGALGGQGENFFEYLMDVSGTNYFRKMALSTSQVGI